MQRLDVIAVGIDACSKGWIAVVLRDDAAPEAVFLSKLSEIRQSIPDAELLAIDIPIGLLSDRQRKADAAARKFVGPRASSIFSTPVRPAFEAENYLEANRISIERCNLGITKQAFALRKKVLEADAWLPDAPCDVREVHPEVSFRELFDAPVQSTKKSWAGMLERREALESVGIDLGHVARDVAVLAGVDDMLDAGVAAWSARRILAGGGRSLPDPPEEGPDGRLIAIWV